MVDTYIAVDKTTVKERSSFTATSHFRAEDAAQAPTTAEYRIDCLDTGEAIQGWTSLTAATRISIPVTSENNRIVDNWHSKERRQLTVSADRGTATETRDTIQWQVENIRGFDE